MGSCSSSISELASNEYLKRLSSSEVILPDDPFWNQLLSFSIVIPCNSADTRLLEETTSMLCKNFAINNCRTGNLGSLVQVFLRRTDELKASAQCENNIFTWQTYNALFIVRNISKYFIENLSEEVILQQFEANSAVNTDESNARTGNVIEDLLNSLVELLVDVPVLNITYALHIEAINCLLVLLAIQMFSPSPASNSNLFRFIMVGRSSMHAGLLTKTLLRNFIAQEKCPAELFKGSDSHGMLYNFTSSVASGLWSVMTLGLAGKSKPKEEDVMSETLLANQSLLFLLVLVNHCTSERGLHNPYREALFSFSNSQNHEDSSSPTVAVATFKLDFSKLFNTLCLRLRDDQTTLLLYLLLHQNQHMKVFILSRTNIDNLVLPLLRILYHADDKNSHHIYMALIILLVLSEDDAFSKAVHEITLKNVVWFMERTICEITLGGLLILVVIRTIQYNITRMRDRYLHTNCLAALANMSAHFTNLHPYVTQRIVSLFCMLSKRHHKLVNKIKNHPVEDGVQRTGADELENEDMSSELQDLQVLEEVIRMVIEIINSCLTHSLHLNPNLIYSLLYQKEVFTQFRSHPTFQDVIQNIDTVLGYFSARIEEHDKGMGVHEVLGVITQASRVFRRERLKKFPELKFKYVEEEQPEEFFIPYVWSLVYHSSNMYFNPSRIQLFSLKS